ncbi:MAG TPA: hypothetical protein VN914_17085, partial [Polyangia bacterium]|nr:hypothetical protein [Polyangia bacterium]
YEESFTSGMIVWVVPLERYRDTYNGHAVWYAALVAQKNHLTLHLMNAYGDPPRAASPIKTERSPPRSAGRVRVGPTFLLDDSTRDRGVRTASPHPSPADRRGAAQREAAAVPRKPRDI